MYNNSCLIILLISNLFYISHIAVFRKVLIHNMFKIVMVNIASSNCDLTLATAPLLCAWTAGLVQYDNTVKRAVQLWQQIIVR
jgi:hypothetical protein